MNKTFEDLQATARENYDAFINSATIASKGAQEIATETAEFASRNVEKGTAAVEKLMAAKTFDKIVEAQQEIVKQAYTDLNDQMVKFGEMYKASATEVLKPFEAQWAKFAPVAGKKAAK